jgi:hypothetical protein
MEANQPADNAQDLKAGAEWMWQNHLALRSGYNFTADALKFSAGAGVNAEDGRHARAHSTMPSRAAGRSAPSTV